MRQKKRNLPLIVMTNVLLYSLFFNSGYADEPGRALRTGAIRENIYASAILSDTTYIMAGDRGKIFRSMDSGKTWREVTSGTKLSLFSVSFPDSKNGWISGKSGLVLHTTDGGITWSKQDSRTKKHLFSINFEDARHGCAVGDWGVIVCTKDGGATWQDVSVKEDVILYGVHIADSKHAWAVGEFGRIFKTGDGGRTWTLVPSPMEEKSLFCLDIEGDSLFAAGLDSIIMYSKDRGKSWQRARNDSKNSIYAIVVRGQTGWAVGDSGTVLRTSDGGQNWQSLDVPEKNKLFWVGTVSLQSGNPRNGLGFAAGAHGIFYNIVGDKLR